MIPRKIAKLLLQNAVSKKRYTASELVSICGSEDAAKEYLLELQEDGYISNAARRYTMPEGISTNILYTITPKGRQKLQDVSKSLLYILLLKAFLFLAGILSAVFAAAGTDFVQHLLKNYLGE